MNDFKLKKKVLLKMIILFLAFISCDKADEPDTIEWTTDEEIPILSWHSIKLAHSSLKGYQELKNCGYTHSLATIWSDEDPITTYNADLLEKALNYAEEVDIKVIAGCYELHTDTENTVRRFMEHPALVGWFLADEPSLGEFLNLGYLANKIKAIDNKNFVYVNLDPINSTPAQMGTSSYMRYLNEYLRLVPVDLVSFDLYPCKLDENGNIYVLDFWYNNLQIIADAAKRERKDFWAFASGTKFESAQASPTINTFRLQMYTNLAYGAQGLQYFVYNTDTTSPVYKAVKAMNKEIQNFAKVFLNAKVVSVTHTGKDIPINTQRFQSAPSVIKTFETGDAGAVVSVLQKGSRRFFVVVSRDINNSLPVTIEVDKSVRRVTKNGTLQRVIGKVTGKIPPGDILVYTWDED